MAQHTITISDLDGGISIRHEGSGGEETAAALLAKGLIEVAQGLLKKATKSPCQCPQCQAKREATTTEPKPTLH